MSVTWSGFGLEEKAINQNGRTIIAIDGRYFRSTEVGTTLGDAPKASNELGWAPTTTFDELVKEMIACDYKTAKQEALVMYGGD